MLAPYVGTVSILKSHRASSGCCPQALSKTSPVLGAVLLGGAALLRVAVPIEGEGLTSCLGSTE